MGAPGKNEEQARFIGAKVDLLFRTLTRPDGKPYTYQHVAAGTGLNFSYLRKLRVGKAASPSRQVLERLTSFFEITPDYWFRSEHTLPRDIQQQHQLSLIVRKIEQANLTPEQLHELDAIIIAMSDSDPPTSEQ